MSRKYRHPPGTMSRRLFSLEEAEAEAIEMLRRYEPEEGYHLAFSGGKDSTVIHHLAVLAGVRFQAFYNCTTIDPPEVVRHIRKHYPDTKWNYPEKSFYQYLRKKGPPTRKRRWC